MASRAHLLNVFRPEGLLYLKDDVRSKQWWRVAQRLAASSDAYIWIRYNTGYLPYQTLVEASRINFQSLSPIHDHISTSVEHVKVA